MTSESLSKMSLSCGWDDGQEEDFDQLHEAIKQGTAKKFSGADEGDSSSSEDDSEPSDSDPGTKLLWACQHGHFDIVQKILQQNPDLAKFADTDGYTALHRACYSNHPEIVRYLLLEAKCDIHALTGDGWTPLHSAARWNSADCVELLLNHGADVNSHSEGGQTPLHLAAFCGNSRETLELLFMAPNVNGSIKNAQGDTALDIAKRNKNCVRYFELLKKDVTAFEED